MLGPRIEPAVITSRQTEVFNASSKALGLSSPFENKGSKANPSSSTSMFLNKPQHEFKAVNNNQTSQSITFGASSEYPKLDSQTQPSSLMSLSGTRPGIIMESKSELVTNPFSSNLPQMLPKASKNILNGTTTSTLGLQFSNTKPPHTYTPQLWQNGLHKPHTGLYTHDGIFGQLLGIVDPIGTEDATAKRLMADTSRSNVSKLPVFKICEERLPVSRDTIVGGRERVFRYRETNRPKHMQGVLEGKNPMEGIEMQAEYNNTMDMYKSKKRIKQNNELFEKWKDHIIDRNIFDHTNENVPKLKKEIAIYGTFSPDAKTTLLDKHKNQEGKSKQVSIFSKFIDEEAMENSSLSFSALTRNESSLFKTPSFIPFNERRRLESKSINLLINYDGILHANVEVQAYLLFDMITVENLIQCIFENILKMRRYEITSVPQIMNSGSYMGKDHRFTSAEIEKFTTSENELEFYIPACSNRQKPHTRPHQKPSETDSSVSYDSSPPLILLNTMQRLSHQISILGFAVWNSLGRVIWQNKFRIVQPLDNLTEIVEITNKGVHLLKSTKVDYRQSDVIIEMN